MVFQWASLVFNLNRHEHALSMKTSGTGTAVMHYKNIPIPCSLLFMSHLMGKHEKRLLCTVDLYSKHIGPAQERHKSRLNLCDQSSAM
jgi:hypothetical protein